LKIRTWKSTCGCGSSFQRLTDSGIETRKASPSGEAFFICIVLISAAVWNGRHQLLPPGGGSRCAALTGCVPPCGWPSPRIWIQTLGHRRIPTRCTLFFSVKSLSNPSLGLGAGDTDDRDRRPSLLLPESDFRKCQNAFEIPDPAPARSPRLSVRIGLVHPAPVLSELALCTPVRRQPLGATATGASTSAPIRPQALHPSDTRDAASSGDLSEMEQFPFVFCP